MRKIATTVALVTVLSAACGGHATRRASEALPPVRASIGLATTLDVPRTVELYGTVEATRTAAVASRVMATVVAVAVKPGDTVAAGQVLLEIDATAAKGQESQARGALAQAEAALALAQRNFERYKALHASHAASDLELDLATMQLEQAKGAVEQARGAVAAAASVAADTRVVAPFAGRVVAKLVEVGDLAAPGRPLVMVESVAGRRLVLHVPENLAAAVKVGAQVPVRIDAVDGGGERLGRVVEATPGADPTSHTFTVKVELPDLDAPSGVAGRATLTVGQRHAVAVPVGAVLQHGGVPMVVVVDGEGKARSRAVTLGGNLGDGRLEVLSGLEGGETVAIGLGSVPPDGTPVEEVRS